MWFFLQLLLWFRKKFYLSSGNPHSWTGLSMSCLEVRPLWVTGKPTGFSGIDGVETSAGFRLVLGFSAAAASLAGGNSCEVPGTGSLGGVGQWTSPLAYWEAQVRYYNVLAPCCFWGVSCFFWKLSHPQFSHHKTSHQLTFLLVPCTIGQIYLLASRTQLLHCLRVVVLSLIL